MVLHAVWGVLHSLLSLPFTPSTYHVLLARAAEARARNKPTSSSFDAFLTKDCIFFLGLLRASGTYYNLG